MNYQKHYDLLTYSRKIFTSFSSNLDFYYENHHIIPKCMGGSDDPENIVLLTAREHYIAHRLLTKIYPKNSSLRDAFKMMRMNKIKRRLTSKQYENIKSIKRIVTEETKQKMRKPKTEEHKRNLSEAAKKRAPHSEETKQKISNGGRGILKPLMNEETRQKMKESAKNRPPVSEETKAKMKESAKNRPQMTEETRKKITNANRGQKRTEEQKEKMRKAQKGKIVSEETKQKMSESAKNRTNTK